MDNPHNTILKLLLNFTLVIFFKSMLKMIKNKTWTLQISYVQYIPNSSFLTDIINKNIIKC